MLNTSYFIVFKHSMLLPYVIHDLPELKMMQYLHGFIIYQLLIAQCHVPVIHFLGNLIVLMFLDW